MDNSPITTEICIECIFAINAPAQGCLVLFSNFSSIVFNISIFRTTPTSNASSCTPVPDSLSRQTVQVFLVSVYDLEGDADVNLSEPAIVLPQPLQIEPVTELSMIISSSSIPQLSTFIAGKTITSTNSYLLNFKVRDILSVVFLL